MKKTLLTLLLLGTLALSACSSTPPLTAYDREIEIERFMGDWYVVGSIPVTIPGFSEEGAHNGVETYTLSDKNKILTTYRFRKDSFDGDLKVFRPVGWVHDETTNTEWRMQFIWPLRAKYLIAWLDEEYQNTIIGVPNRNYVWLMSRNWQLSEDEYAALVNEATSLGYDPALIQRVPQQWPENPEVVVQ